MVVTLIPPPSANKLWRTFRGRTVRSSAYNDWLEYAAEVIRKEPNFHQFDEPVRVSITLFPGKGVTRLADLDNLIKPVLDVLCPEKLGTEGEVKKPGTGVIQDDNLGHVHEVVVRLASSEPRVKKGKEKLPAIIAVRVRSMTEHQRIVARMVDEGVS